MLLYVFQEIGPLFGYPLMILIQKNLIINIFPVLNPKNYITTLKLYI